MTTERLNVKNFDQLYGWLKANHDREPYVWVNARRGKPNGKDFNYIDAVYCALCFGWIDSTCRNVDGILYQKLMPRKSGSHWTYLNIARCIYLEHQGLLTTAGKFLMPDHYEQFKIPIDIGNALKSDKEVWKNFISFPQLYRRIRIDNIVWARQKNNPEMADKRLQKLIDTSRRGKMYGQWNDYGRLVGKKADTPA